MTKKDIIAGLLGIRHEGGKVILGETPYHVSKYYMKTDGTVGVTTEQAATIVHYVEDITLEELYGDVISESDGLCMKNLDNIINKKFYNLKGEEIDPGYKSKALARKEFLNGKI